MASIQRPWKSPAAKRWRRDATSVAMGDWDVRRRGRKRVTFGSRNSMERFVSLGSPRYVVNAPAKAEAQAARAGRGMWRRTRTGVERIVSGGGGGGAGAGASLED